MPIPPKRFDIYGQETNTPVSDFMEYDNAGVQNVDKGDSATPPSPTSEPIEEDKLLDTLPVIDGVLKTDTDVTKAFIAKLSPDHVTHVLNKELSESLGQDMGNIFKNTSRHIPTSLMFNKVLSRLPQSECERDLNRLLEMLKRLGLPFDIKFDINAALAALLAILFKLMCAGVKNAFGSIYGISSNGQLLASAAAGMIIAAAKNSYPDAVLDVAGTPIASNIREQVPDIANIALGTLDGFTPDLTETSYTEFNTNFKNALDALDPNWKQTVNGEFSIEKLSPISKPYDDILTMAMLSNTPTIPNNTIPTPTPSEDLKITTGVKFIPGPLCNIKNNLMDRMLT